MAERKFDPAEKMIDLLDDLTFDRTKFAKEIEHVLDNVNDDDLKRELIKETVDIEKLKLAVLKALQDAKQKEDDQYIKIKDQLIRKEELQLKRETQTNKQGSGDGRVVNQYIVPNYNVTIINGKKVLEKKEVDLISQNEQ